MTNASWTHELPANAGEELHPHQLLVLLETLFGQENRPPLDTAGQLYLALLSSLPPVNNSEPTKPSKPAEPDGLGQGLGKDLRHAYFRYPASTAAALRWAGSHIRRGRAVHLCPHLLTARRRLKTNAAPILALWADADEARPPDGFPPPTLTVESSPGNLHLYWSLRRVLDPTRAQALNRRLTYTIGADPGGWALGSIFRIPGSSNHKHNEALCPKVPGQLSPRTPSARVISYRPDLAYHPREIEQYLGPDPHDDGRNTGTDDVLDPDTLQNLGESPHHVRGGNRRLTAAELPKLSQRMRELIAAGNAGCGEPYPSRSEADFAVAIAMLGMNFEEEAIKSVFRDPANGISEKYLERGSYGDYYLDRTIREARKRVEPPNPANRAHLPEQTITHCRRGRPAIQRSPTA